MDMQGKITLTDFNPKLILSQGDEVQELTLGRLTGIANSVVTKKMPDGMTVFNGLGGVFQAVFLAPNAKGEIKPAVRSGELFMPDSFINPMIDALRDKVDDETGEVTQAGAEEIRFAFDVVVFRASNPQKYSWRLKPLIEVQANDPLAALNAQVNAALPAPSGQTTEQVAAKTPKGK